MRILNIMQGTNLGGMEQASLSLMIALKARGHTCEVLSLNPIGTLGPLLMQHGIPAKGLQYRGKGGWKSFFSMRSAMRSIEADAVIMTGHNLLAMLALGDICAGRRLLAIHFHHEGVKPLWQWRLIYAVACRKFDAITFPSDFIRAEAEAICPRLGRLSRILRNPIAMPEVPSDAQIAAARSVLGLPAGSKVVGNAGWLIRRKRFDVFLRVARKVLDSIPGTVFLIAGEGEERPKLEALAVELNVHDRIRWLGWQKDLSQFYSSLDVMLFNSDFDAMGMSPLEAISYGVPVVASVVKGGLKEVIGNSEAASVIPEHDLELLSSRVVNLLRSPAAARKATMAVRAEIARVSDADEISQVVESLLSGTDGK